MESELDGLGRLMDEPARPYAAFIGGAKVSTKTAPLEALRSLKKPCRVRLVSDSRYLVSGMKEWVHGWIRRGWRRARNKKVENEDLWKALMRSAESHHIDWQWTRGHSGHPDNERCDQLAKAAIGKLPRSG